MKVKDFRKLIREEVRKVLKENPDQLGINIVTDLKAAKPGMKVWRLLERDNPQLGVYHVFELVDITKVTPSTIICGDSNKYNKLTGVRINASSTSYGSATYSIMGLADAEKMNQELTAAGEKVRGFKK